MKKFILIFFIQVFAVASAFADDPRTLLLNRPTKPTVKEFLQTFGGALPAQDPFLDPAVDQSRLNKLQEIFQMIAQLEWAYPGARYAFLGRDSTHIADMFEAFYLSRGETDRVYRIEGSGPTVNPASLDDLAEWTAQLGLRPKDQNDRVVVLDATEWAIRDGNPSQIRKLLGAMYSKFFTADEAAQRPSIDDPSSIAYENSLRVHRLSRLSAVAFKRSAGESRPDIPVNVELKTPTLWQPTEMSGGAPHWLSRPEWMWPGAKDPVPQRVYQVSGNLSYNQGRYMGNHVDMEWHGSYGALYRERGGALKAVAPSVSGEHIRRAVLSYMYNIIKFMQNPSASTQVDFFAKRLGYDYAKAFKMYKYVHSGALETVSMPNWSSPYQLSAHIGEFKKNFKDLPYAMQFDLANQFVRAFKKASEDPAVSDETLFVAKNLIFEMASRDAMLAQEFAVTVQPIFVHKEKRLLRLLLSAEGTPENLRASDQAPFWKTFAADKNFNWKQMRAFEIEKAVKAAIEYLDFSKDLPMQMKVLDGVQNLDSMLSQVLSLELKKRDLTLSQWLSVAEALAASLKIDFMRSSMTSGLLLDVTRSGSVNGLADLLSLHARFTQVISSVGFSPTEVEIANRLFAIQVARVLPTAHLKVKELNVVLNRFDAAPKLKEIVYEGVFNSITTGSEYTRIQKPALGRRSENYENIDLQFRKKAGLWHEPEIGAASAGQGSAKICRELFKGAAS